MALGYHQRPASISKPVVGLHFLDSLSPPSVVSFLVYGSLGSLTWRSLTIPTCVVSVSSLELKRCPISGSGSDINPCFSFVASIVHRPLSWPAAYFVAEVATSATKAKSYAVLSEGGSDQIQAESF
jgi:hypothetical protein